LHSDVETTSLSFSANDLSFSAIILFFASNSFSIFSYSFSFWQANQRPCKKNRDTPVFHQALKNSVVYGIGYDHDASSFMTAKYNILFS
jgi:hypothetical protein